MKRDVPKHFHFVVPVWGESYTRLFVDICLPMLLTPGNLRICTGRAHERFVILTTWEDWRVMQDAPSIKALREIMEVEAILINGLIDITYPHIAMSACYARAMESEHVVPNATHFVFLTPDSFWSEGAFRRLIELSEENYKVVMVAGLRVNAEDMSVILDAWLKAHPEDPSMPMTQLVRLVLDHLHQLSRAHDWNTKDGFLNAWPSHLYWINKDDRQLIAHCFHMHPLMLQAPKKIPPIRDTIDGAFLSALGYPASCYYVVQGDFLGVELSPAARTWGQPLGAPSLPAVRRFAILNASPMHWHFFTKRILLNGTPEKPIPHTMEVLVDEVVKQVRSKMHYARYAQIFVPFITRIKHSLFLRRLLRIPYKCVRRLMR